MLETKDELVSPSARLSHGEDTLRPSVAALPAWFLTPDMRAAAAYVGGAMGTLLGADLLNLGRVRGLGAPVASIGGAGTFDGIFVTGVVAVLLA